MLLKSSELKQARTIYSFTVPLLARYLIPVLALLVLVGVWVSRRRARLVMGIGIGVVLGMLVLSAGLAVGKTALADASPDSQAQSLLNVFWITLTRYLANGISAWLSVGVVVALIGWFGGRSKPATAVRAAISTSLVDAGHRFDGGDAIGSFARDHWRAVFIGLGALGTGSIFLFNPPSVAVVVWITIICLALAALVTFARGWGAGSDAGLRLPGDGRACCSHQRLSSTSAWSGPSRPRQGAVPAGGGRHDRPQDRAGYRGLP